MGARAAIRLITMLCFIACAWLIPTAARATYWSLFNVEGESTLSAQYVTYTSLTDMLADTNRLGVFTPNPLGFGVNIVGSGSDVLSAVSPISEPGVLALLIIALGGLAFSGRKVDQVART